MAIQRKKRDASEFRYDVCLSFAGEQRPYVRAVAAALASRGLRVFYDEYEKVNLWGKDLYAHLDDIYQHLARFCVLFVSSDYAAKVWTSHERRSAQARAISEQGEYILPARFDETAVPGLPDTIGYVDLNELAAPDLATLIQQKVGSPSKKNYLPPAPDRLFLRLGIDDDAEAQEMAHSQAHRFLECLQRMTEAEREVVVTLVKNACPAELPENLHIYIDLLRRLTGFSVPKMKRLLGGLNSLGFTSTIRESHDDEDEDQPPLGDAKLFQLKWSDLMDNGAYPEMLVAYEMIQGATEGYCEEHGLEALRRLDFSQLAAATASVDVHRVRKKPARKKAKAQKKKATPKRRAAPKAKRSR